MPSPKKSAGSLKSLTRGEKTRQRIRATVERLLEEESNSDLAITQICRSAGVAIGGFYFHYKNKDELIQEIFSIHFSALWQDLHLALKYGDLYQVVSYTNEVLVRAVSQRPGLFRCYNQRAAVDRSLVTLWEESLTEWALIFAAKLLRDSDAQVSSSSEAFIEVFSLLSYTDSLLCQIFVERDPELASYAINIPKLTEYLSVSWFRALTGEDPDPQRLAFH